MQRRAVHANGWARRARPARARCIGVGLVTVAVFSGCAGVTGDQSSAPSTSGRAVHALETRDGWRMTARDIWPDPPTPGFSPGSRFSVLDTLDGLMLMWTKPTDRGQGVVRLIDRQSGETRWNRSDMRECFFETAHRIWCTPTSSAGISVTDTDRAIVDDAGKVLRRLRRGPATAAGSAVARNRGDIELPPTLPLATNNQGAYGTSDEHRFQVRLRADNRALVAAERNDYGYTASAQSYDAGFATSLTRDGTDGTATLYDNRATPLTTVRGLTAGPASLRCALPVLYLSPIGDRFRMALIDPRSGAILYRMAEDLSFPVCGKGYLVDGTVFVERDGRARQLPINPEQVRSGLRVAASASVIAIITSEQIRFVDRRDLTLRGERPLPAGTEIAYVDDTSVITMGPDGIEYIRY